MTQLSIEEAQRILLDSAVPITQTEQCLLDDMVGRVAAEAVCAVYAQPPFDRSPLDGYALCSADIASATRDNPVQLSVSAHIFSEPCPPLELTAGCAARITTGGAIPAGADCVVQQERTDYGEETVSIFTSLPSGRNICRKGEDLSVGEIIVKPATRLTPAHIGLLAGQGILSILVYRQPHVTVISTGNEVLQPGSSLTPGAVFDCNGPYLGARLRQLSSTVCRQHVPDDSQLLSAALQQALECSDIVITSGGASVGPRDLLPSVAADLGLRLLFDRVDVKPGGHMQAYAGNGSLLLCVSGNPFAAAITTELFAVPLLLHMAGCSNYTPRRDTLTFQGSYPKASQKRQMLRAFAADGIVSFPCKNHHSGTLVGLSDCNCIIDIAPGTPPLQGGEKVLVIFFERI